MCSSLTLPTSHVGLQWNCIFEGKKGIVTYSGFSIHDWSLLHSKSQYTTVKHSRQLFEHTYTSDPHSLGTLTPIEFFQQDLLWQSSNTHSHSCIQKASKHTRSIRHRAIGSLAHRNGTSAYSPSLACHLPAPTIECLHRPPYKLTCSSRQSVGPRITFKLYSFSDHTDNFIRSPVSTEIHKHPTRNHRHTRSLLWAPQCCLFTLLPPSIVAYLRKRNVILSHCYNSANVYEPREPHTCNNI
jgi:hypothetical protein